MRASGKLALCAICQLPRARLFTMAFLDSTVTFSSCPCVTRDAVMLPDWARVIPMSENRDPGDEDQS